MMTATKKSKTNTKPSQPKVYREAKKGWIDRLSEYLLKFVDTKGSEGFPPVTNIRRAIAYFIDYILANILVVIPLVLIQGGVLQTTNTTQDLSRMELPYVYLITGVVFLLYVFYYVVVPYKIWPGQTPAKKLLGIKIVMKNNSDVTLGALFMRNVVCYILLDGSVFMTSYLIQLVALTMGVPIPKIISDVMYFVTFLSIIVTMTNQNRRMLHDLISGTKIYKINEEKESYKSF